MAGRTRSAASLDRWVLLLAAILVVVGIGLPLIGLKVFLGTDLLFARAPWNAATPADFTPHLPCVSDTVDSVLPATREFRTRLGQGDVAGWDPYGAGGSPLASVPSPGVYSPLSLPYLVLPLWLAPAFVKLLEMAVSLGGMFLFLRRVGTGRAAALLGGVVYTSSGFMVVWTNWPQTRVAAFLPALFWTVERLVERRRALDVVLVAAVVASLLLGGFPAVAGFALYAAALYLLVRLAVEHRRRIWRAVGGAAAAGAGLALGAGVTAVLLLPFAFQLRGLNLGYRDQSPAAHLPPTSLVTAFVPDAFGTCLHGVYYGPTNPIDVIAFVGVTAVLLGIVGIVARPGAGAARGVRGYLIVGLGVVLILGWLGGPLLAFAQQFPVFSNNGVSRIRVLLGFFAACLAGLGYDALVRGVEPGRGPVWRRAAAAAVWVLAAAGAATLGWRAIAAVDARGHLRDLVVHARLPAVAGTLGVVLVVVATLRRPAARRVALALLPVLVLVESLAFVVPFWPRTDRSEFYPVTPAHAFLADRLGHDRFGGEGLTMYPATSLYYGVRSVTGHAFAQRTWNELLRAVDPKVQASPTFTAFSTRNSPTAVRSPVLDRLAVRYFVFDPGMTPLGDAASIGVPAGERSLADGDSVEVRVSAQALRGAGPVLTASMARPADRFARLDLEVRDPDGSIVAQASRRLRTAVTAPGPLLVALPGEYLTAARGPLRLRLTLRSAGGQIRIATTRSGQPVLRVVRPAPDGLRLVFSDGAVIYERLSALPRIRWASSATVIENPKARVAALAHDLPADTVVLGSPPAGVPPGAPAGGPAGGPAARIEQQEDSGDRIVVRVDAPRAGYLVVADALQSGWTATVDGRPAALQSADHALVAVATPPGRHDVRLDYTPAGRSAGSLITALAAAALLGLLGLDLAQQRRRRAAPPPDHRPLPTAPADGRPADLVSRP